MSATATSRLRILRAATSIASEYGYIGATISKITMKAGLPTSSIYWYFEDKDHLMAEVIDHCYAEWASSFPPQSDLPQPPVPLGEALRMVMSAGSQTLEAAPDFLRIGHMLLLEARDGEDVARQRIIAIRSKIVEQTAQWLAKFLPETAPETLAPDLARLLIASHDGLFLARQRGETWDSEHIVDLIVATTEVAVAEAGS